MASNHRQKTAATRAHGKRGQASKCRFRHCAFSACPLFGCLSPFGSVRHPGTKCRDNHCRRCNRRDSLLSKTLPRAGFAPSRVNRGQASIRRFRHRAFRACPRFAACPFWVVPVPFAWCCAFWVVPVPFWVAVLLANPLGHPRRTPALGMNVVILLFSSPRSRATAFGKWHNSHPRRQRQSLSNPE